MKKNVSDLILLGIHRSDVTLEEAIALAEINQWNGVINRLCYIAFYAVSMLLLKKEIYAKTHSSLKSEINEEIIKKGELPASSGKVYDYLFS